MDRGPSALTGRNGSEAARAQWPFGRKAHLHGAAARVHRTVPEPSARLVQIVLISAAHAFDSHVERGVLEFLRVHIDASVDRLACDGARDQHLADPALLKGRRRCPFWRHTSIVVWLTATLNTANRPYLSTAHSRARSGTLAGGPTGEAWGNRANPLMAGMGRKQTLAIGLRSGRRRGAIV